MEERVIQLIKNEDKKNPLSDEQIAKKLSIFRENVTTIRNKYNIQNSRERRNRLLVQDIKKLIEEHGDLSVRKLTRLLNDQGYDVGKFVIGSLKKELEEIQEFKPIKTEKEKHLDLIQDETSSEKALKEKSQNASDIFSAFIGYDGSMKSQISRAKAAILYPPYGLHTLIYGPSGVGKSFLAEMMYKYAVKIRNYRENIPFYEFNCADYADNPQLLLTQLFGYNKGAFTGAVVDKPGIVEFCDGGILFLDEIHRLTPKGQEMLFYLIDKGKFRRLGEIDTQRKSTVMIIGATTENPESTLLLTFRRRIPMLIEIPPIKDRPLSEKLQFTQNNFMTESRRIGCELQVKEDVLKCLLDAEYQGNLGQLKSDIQVCCAKAFLDAKIRHKDTIVVRLDSLSEELKESYDDRLVRKEINDLIYSDIYYSPEDNIVYEQSAIERSKNIYDELDYKYEEMKRQGISKTKISGVLSQELEKTLSKYIKNVENYKFSLQEVSSIVGDKILNITKEIYENAKKSLPSLRNTIIFPLAIHINMAMERVRSNKGINNLNLKAISEQSPKEYTVAKKIVKIIQQKYYINLLEEEIGFLAMYFKNFQSHSQMNKEKIGLLVVSHGKVACGMSETANTIMGTDYAVGLEMNFQDSPSSMIDKVINVVKQIDQEKGCLILADMGSLTTMGGKIERETGISVRIVARADTLMVIEAIRKVLWTSKSLDQIAEELDIKNNGTLQTKEKNNQELKDKDKQNVILCLCITGEGVAKTVRNHIRTYLEEDLKNITILTKGYIEGEKVENIIESIAKNYRIVAVVGTIDPQVMGYPFISVTEIFKSQGLDKLQRMIKRHNLFEENHLNEVIKSENIFVNPRYTYKDEVIDNAINKLIKDGYVKPEFLLSVYKRESQMTTYLEGGIAIPHGYTELVTKPVISITKLDNPIIWDGVNFVDIIFVLALNENSKKYFDELYSIISNKSLLSAIRSSQSSEEILNILCINTKPVK
ncbi:sigma 54-interacting transcriptional regulator [Clostridium sp. D2Q-14]|uniref:sigma 54-interacting transcriptional regulator n=1 Tax=Anaeromonas gelatinilytica TaxID=2683194 RepID=UPI00193BDEEF|nr:sigma 54-interacting transcriptional regulator [Anaeromonas gelatinilytica]MBS4535087.1 sigma 54-interacting transcriptional regulator [Anaeromonas gelatinilytica]